MIEHQASRTLLKSPPELWTECSDAQSLARHLGEFGEIRITRLEHERTVAWEGERASGTVTLQASGWGTKVTLTAAIQRAERIDMTPPDPPKPEREPTPELPNPVAARAPAPPALRRTGLVERIRRWFIPQEPKPGPIVSAKAPDSAAPPPEPVVIETPEPQPVPSGAEIALAAALDSLGKAHHRPFSRA
jgi:hypothetical protein